MTHLVATADKELNEIIERLQKTNKKYYLSWDFATGKITEVESTDKELLDYCKANNSELK